MVVWGQVHKMSCWSPLCCSKGFPDCDFVLRLLVPEIVSNSVMQIFTFPWVLCRIWCLICRLIVGVVWWQTLTCGSHSFATVTVVWTANNCSPSGSLSSSIHSSLNLVQHFKTLGWYRASFPWTVVSILCFCSHVPEFEAKLVCSLLYDKKRNVTCDGLMKLEFYFH
jgi:hypothetical protein